MLCLLEYFTHAIDKVGETQIYNISAAQLQIWIC